MSRRVLIAGGGSGGHVSPGLAVVRELRDLPQPPELHWLGSIGGIEERLVRPAGLPVTLIHAGKLNRYVSLKTVRDLAKVPLGMADAMQFVRRWRPDVVLTCGGYVAVPAGIAAALNRVPIIALQQDLRPNLANKLIAPFATTIGVGFAASVRFFPDGKAVWVGNPVRSEVLLGDASAGRALFGLPANVPVVLVMGGSQGARGINRLLLAELPQWLRHTAILHICGASGDAEALAAAAALPPGLRSRYVWRSYVSEGIGHALALADVVVTRSGASTLAELAVLGKAACLIPLPPGVGASPQEANALALQQAGAAEVLLEAQATPALLRDRVLALLADAARRDALGRQISRFGQPRSAASVAQLVLSHLR